MAQIIPPKLPEPRCVYLSFHFLRFGEIDTKKQMFKAEIVIEARWYEPFLASHVKQSDFETFSGHLWDPKLIIVNLEGVQAGINHVTECIKTDKENRPYILRSHRIRGVFFEKMELFEFPRDVQDLNVTVMSELPLDEIELENDKSRPSTMRKEMCQFENTFSPFDHVEVIPGSIPDPTKQTNFTVPIITATCRVARNPKFFIWNNYLFLTCLAFLSLSVFAIDPKHVEYRLAVLLTILLTSVTFKLSTAGKLPVISYFTLLDIYTMMSFFFVMAITIEVSVLSIWKKEEYVQELDIWSVRTIATLLVLFNVVYWIWFVKKTSKRHCEIKEKVKQARKNPYNLRTQRKPSRTYMKFHEELKYEPEIGSEWLPELGGKYSSEGDSLVVISSLKYAENMIEESAFSNEAKASSKAK